MKYLRTLSVACLLLVVSCSAMDMKKLSVVTKLKEHTFDKNSTHFLKNNLSKSLKKDFHTSSSNISFEKSTEIKSFDLNKKGKFTSILAKKYMNDKVYITQDENGKYYCNGSEIAVVTNGPTGAAVGAFVGFWGTYVICHGVISGVCRVIDVVVPIGGVAGGAAQAVIVKSLEPAIVLASKKVGIALGIAGGVGTPI
jgi:hypothetical protein